MARIVKGDLDTALPTLTLNDFSGGLNTMEGPWDLSSNETPDAQNVLGFPGRGLYVGGTSLLTSLPGNADGGIEFNDTNGNKHDIVWANGNMYDTVNGTQVLITGNIYTPGQNIGMTISQQGVLYWTTPTVTLRQYDGTTEKAVVTSGAAGSVAIPSGSYLTTYAGSIIVANPTIGGTKNPGSLIPSNTNDPTTFLGANLTALGQNNTLQALIPMSVEAGGVPPTSSIMCVGTTGLVLAQGVITAFKLNNINYPIGCKDANSVVYIPTGDILGNVMYLGNDNQFHLSNGITTQLKSSKILNLMNSLVSNSILANPSQRFSASYNTRYHYYICDLGQDVQMIFKWTKMPDGSIREGFFKISGWPSGFYFQGTTGTGFPTNYVAVNGTDTPGLYQVGVDGANFNGVQPTVYYQTPYLHANDVSMMKEYQWMNMTMNNSVAANYTVDATGMVDASNTQPTAKQILFKSPANSAVSNAANLWDTGKWDQALWSASSGLPTYLPAVVSKMLTISVKDALGNTVNAPLRSGAVSFKIGWSPINSSAIAYFDMSEFGVRFKPMGHYMVGGATGSAEAA